MQTPAKKGSTASRLTQIKKLRAAQLTMVKYGCSDIGDLDAEIYKIKSELCNEVVYQIKEYLHRSASYDTAVIVNDLKNILKNC